MSAARSRVRKALKCFGWHCGMNFSLSGGMTAPRNVRPGVTWFVTRRTTRRQHLFTPDEAGLVEQLYWYLTAVYAKRFGIELHMMQLLSSHLHEVLTDTLGVLPDFYRFRNRELANGLKVMLGWPEEVMAKARANWVELRTADAMVQEMAYTAANCVADGLVRTPRRWPGAKVLMNEVGKRVMRIERPKMYFNPNNPDWPDEVEIPITMPRVLQEAYGSDDRSREVLQHKLDSLVRKAHRENSKSGRGYAGAKAILKMRHTRRSSSPERFGSRTPSFAAAGNAEVKRTFIQERRTFLSHHREAWLAWSAGDHTVEFPYGTWKMRVSHGARCSPAP